MENQYCHFSCQPDPSKLTAMNCGGVSPGFSLVITNPSGSVIELPEEVLVTGVDEAGPELADDPDAEDPADPEDPEDLFDEADEAARDVVVCAEDGACDPDAEVAVDGGAYTVVETMSGPTDGLLQAAAVSASAPIRMLPARRRRWCFTILRSVVTFST
jgi:hypothetical protein